MDKPAVSGMCPRHAQPGPWVLLAGLLFFSPPLTAATLYVDAGLGDDFCDGSQPSRLSPAVGPKAAIQAALDAAADGDLILVADGRYTGPGNRDLDFWGKPLTLRSQGGPDRCTLDAQASSDNPHRLFTFQSGESPQTVVEGFTLTAGHSGWAWGGAVSCEYASPTFRRCVFRGNATLGKGGALYCGDGSGVILEDCLLTDNTADDGGALHAWAADVTLRRCTLRGNRAAGNSPSGHGGALGLENQSSLTLSACTLAANYAGTFGGALYAADSQLTLANCLLAGNRAASHGGGLYAENAAAEWLNCTVTGNRARWYGGGLRARGQSNLPLKNCILWNNEVGPGGAGGNLTLGSQTTLTAAFCDIQGSQDLIGKETGAVVLWQQGNFDADPAFARPGRWLDGGAPDNYTDDTWLDGDYHLRSLVGRWHPNFVGPADLNDDGMVNLADFALLTACWQGTPTPPLAAPPATLTAWQVYLPALTDGSAGDINLDGRVDLADLSLLAQHFLQPAPGAGRWVRDGIHSPCIDAGDPAAGPADEPWPHGRRLNLGADGGTSQASLSLVADGNPANFHGAGRVNLLDFARLSRGWLTPVELDPADLNRNGLVDLPDLILLLNQWLQP